MNRNNGFIMKMKQKIIEKIECWRKELMDRQELKF